MLTTPVENVADTVEMWRYCWTGLTQILLLLLNVADFYYVVLVG